MKILIAVLVAGVVTIPPLASAADVSLSAAPYTGPSDVSTAGSFVVAIAAADAADVTENGVTFAADSTGIGSAGGVTIQYFGNPATSGSTDDLAGNPDLFDNHIFTNGGGDGSFNITGLSESTPYEVQLFIGDTRGCCAARFVHVWGEGDTTGDPALTVSPISDNYVVTGTFMTGAAETSQSLFIAIDDDADFANGIGFGGFDGHVNAFQLRQIPEPASAVALLAGVCGIAVTGQRRC